MTVFKSIFFALIYLKPVVAHKYSTVNSFLLNYKYNESIAFYKVFPLPDTSKVFDKVKGYAGYTDKSLLFIIEIDSTIPVSSSKGFDNSAIFQGDYAMLTLSTYQSREFAYVFVGSPSGGNSEFMTTQHGFSTKEWDGLWYYRAVIEGNKWIALFVIPFKTIFFEDSIFYINGSVNFHNDNVMVATNYNQPFMRLENMQKIVLGSTVTRQSAFKINLFPYLRVNKNCRDSNLKKQIGGNIEVKMSENTIFEGSINPDFSTIDADVVSFDLSVEPRYFPEKRKFFLEGAKNFSFDLPLFYTRNIDTVKLGIKGNVENRYFSVYGLYTRYNTERRFKGIGVNIYPDGNLPNPYFRGFYDDSVPMLCAGLRKYINELNTFVSIEGAVHARNGSRGMSINISRNVYPGLSFGTSYMITDSNLISPIGKMWYNNKLIYDFYGSYSWVNSKNQSIRASVIGYYRKIGVRSTGEDIFSTSNLNVQLIIPTNIFIRSGFRRNVFGVNEVSEGVEAAVGKSGVFGNFNIYVFKSLGEKDIFVSVRGDLFLLESTISYSINKKMVSGQADTTLLQLWGEIPIIKHLYIKPYVKYEFNQRNLHSDVKLFYFINRFTQLALVGNSDYSLDKHKFLQNAYLFRFQLYFQLI